jgi:hypothetical protein
MQRILDERATLRLARRAPLPVDARRSIAVKRDVHEFVVDTDATRFAQAFREVVTDPESTFGLIRVKRPAARVGRDFEVGERFQGCFSLELAARRWLGDGAAGLLATRGGRALAGVIEDLALSDYAEVAVIEEDPEAGRHVLEYRYLEGTPIAGRSVFTIEPEGAGRCRVRQVFEYQEVNGFALATFQRFGLKLHDQVVHMEIERAAERAGARLVEATIPREYVEL